MCGYPIVNIKEMLPSLVDLFGKVEAFKGLDALPDALARIFANGIVPND
jgi:hypothetical protein